jgi:hypothetical protein
LLKARGFGAGLYAALNVAGFGENHIFWRSDFAQKQQKCFLLFLQLDAGIVYRLKLKRSLRFKR